MMCLYHMLLYLLYYLYIYIYMYICYIIQGQTYILPAKIRDRPSQIEYQVGLQETMPEPNSQTPLTKMCGHSAKLRAIGSRH